MPETEAALARFRAANTQVLGVSIDSVHSHANWARDLGGVSFPLLADFEPKGAMARGFGHYIEAAGIGDRATVIIDKSGKVAYSNSVTPAGKRDIGELAAECEKLNAGGASERPAPGSVPAGTTLFVKTGCGHCKRALNGVANLDLGDSVAVRDVTADSAAAAELEKHGQNQAPCLVLNGKPIYEAAAITQELANLVAPV